MTNKSPVAVAILSMVTCGIYAIVWYVQTAEEMNKKGADIPSWIYLFIPILNIIYLLKYCEGVEKVTKNALSKVNAIIFLLFLGVIGMAIIQSKFNEVK